MPFPNYLRPLFQSESRCSSFHMQINFRSQAHPSLVFIHRPGHIAILVATLNFLVPVVQRADNLIQRANHYPAETTRPFLGLISFLPLWMFFVHTLIPHSLNTNMYIVHLKVTSHMVNNILAQGYYCYHACVTSSPKTPEESILQLCVGWPGLSVEARLEVTLFWYKPLCPSRANVG